jgi:hypothetical protein
MVREHERRAGGEGTSIFEEVWFRQEVGLW